LIFANLVVGKKKKEGGKNIAKSIVGSHALKPVFDEEGGKDLRGREGKGEREGKKGAPAFMAFNDGKAEKRIRGEEGEKVSKKEKEKRGRKEKKGGGTRETCLIGELLWKRGVGKGKGQEVYGDRRTGKGRGKEKDLRNLKQLKYTQELQEKWGEAKWNKEKKRKWGSVAPGINSSGGKEKGDQGAVKKGKKGGRGGRGGEQTRLAILSSSLSLSLNCLKRVKNEGGGAKGERKRGGRGGKPR